MGIPPPCSGSGRLVTDTAAQDVTCPGCGRVAHVRTDRRIQRHSAPATAGKDT